MYLPIFYMMRSPSIWTGDRDPTSPHRAEQSPPEDARGGTHLEGNHLLSQRQQPSSIPTRHSAASVPGVSGPLNGPVYRRRGSSMSTGDPERNAAIGLSTFVSARPANFPPSGTPGDYSQPTCPDGRPPSEGEQTGADLEMYSKQRGAGAISRDGTAHPTHPTAAERLGSLSLRPRQHLRPSLEARVAVSPTHQSTGANPGKSSAVPIWTCRTVASTASGMLTPPPIKGSVQASCVKHVCEASRLWLLLLFLSCGCAMPPRGDVDF